MRPDRAIERVYLHRAPVDFRKQMDGLGALVEQVMPVSPLSCAFCGGTSTRTLVPAATSSR